MDGRMIAKAIEYATIELGRPSTLEILSFIATLGFLIATFQSLSVAESTLRQLRKESQDSKDFQKELKALDVEQHVLREDILVTVLPVYSGDNFAKCKTEKPYMGPRGILKVFSGDNGMNWNYEITQTFMYEESVIETSLNDPRFKGGFRSKFSCIEYAMGTHGLKSTDIKRNGFIEYDDLP